MRDPRARRVALWLGAALAAIAIAAAPALVTNLPALAAVEQTTLSEDDRQAQMIDAVTTLLAADPRGAEGQSPVIVADTRIRWFNGRPMRPARTVTMRVTAYSPDPASCGEYADGYTATMHPVTTNRGKLVAADQRMFPYGSLLSIPGYDEGKIVPVLDCGGAIKGNRLDVLFPTHEQALQWGVKNLDVTVWEPVDDKPLDDPRKLR